MPQVCKKGRSFSRNSSLDPRQSSWKTDFVKFRRKAPLFVFHFETQPPFIIICTEKNSLNYDRNWSFQTSISNVLHFSRLLPHSISQLFEFKWCFICSQELISVIGKDRSRSLRNVTWIVNKWCAINCL